MCTLEVDHASLVDEANYGWSVSKRSYNILDLV